MMDYVQDFTVQDGILIKYNGSSADVCIPDDITKIDGKAFYNCTNLTSITIPEGVEEIGRNAFYKCTNLSCVSIPASLTTIMENPFAGCTSLQEFIVHPRNPVLYADRAMLFQKGRTLHTIRPVQANSFPIQEGATAVNIGVLLGIPQLERISVPPENLIFSDNNALYIQEGGDILVSCPSATGDFLISAGISEIGEFAFSECAKLTDITVPAGVISIGNNAFSYCTGLINATIPSGVEKIGENCFCGCTKLHSIIIPESVAEIGRSAFYNCSSLTSINIPEGITEIGQRIFYMCTSLTSIMIPKSVTKIGDRVMRFGGAFDGCTNLKEIVVLSASMKERIENFSHNSSKSFHTYEDTTLEVEDFESKDCLSHTVMLTNDSALIAPNMPFSSLSKKLQPAAVRGFAKWNSQGKQYSEERQAEYIKYIKSRRKRLYDEALHNNALLQLMLSEKIIPKNDVSGLVDRATELGDATITAMLLEYRGRI